MAIRKECPGCHALVDINTDVCPECGYDPECPCCILSEDKEEEPCEPAPVW